MKLITLDPPPRGGEQTELQNDLLALARRIAERIRVTGRRRKLRDMTINLPVDHAAISVLDQACEAISQGEFSPELSELDRMIGRLAADPAMSARLGPAMKNLADRLLAGGF